MSLAIAYGLGGALAAVGVVVSLVYVGSARATTAIGTLLPVLSDTGELSTELGTDPLAAGAVGEFGPVLLLTLVLSTQSALVHNAGHTDCVRRPGGGRCPAWRSGPPAAHCLSSSEPSKSSSQLAVRWIVVLVFALGLLASNLGLDLLLGGFAAGMITRLGAAKERGLAFDSKLTAVAFGVFIPFFFVVSGMRLDIDALFASASGVAKLVLFLRAVPGGPRNPCPVCSIAACCPLRRTAWRLHCSSATQLPLVVAITTIAVAGRPHAAHRPRPRSSAPGRSRPSPDRSTGCTCAGSQRASARPNIPRKQSCREPTSRVSRDLAAATLSERVVA